MVCKTDTHLIILSKNGFDRIIGELEKQKIMNKIQFLKQFEFFKFIPNSKLMSLLMDFEELIIYKNHYLYKEGDQINEIYLLKKGEVEITKQIDLYTQPSE